LLAANVILPLGEVTVLPLVGFEGHFKAGKKTGNKEGKRTEETNLEINFWLRPWLHLASERFCDIRKKLLTKFILVQVC